MVFLRCWQAPGEHLPREPRLQQGPACGKLPTISRALDKKKTSLSLLGLLGITLSPASAEGRWLRYAGAGSRVGSKGVSAAGQEASQAALYALYERWCAQLCGKMISDYAS